MSGTASFSWSTRTDRQAVSPRITQVFLELTTVCNLRCRTCIRPAIEGFRPVNMTPGIFEQSIAMLRHVRPERLVLLGFGEALCHPRIRSILTRLRAIETRIVLVTNGSFLDADMARLLAALPLDEIWLSWDDDIEGGQGRIRVGASAAIFRCHLAGLLEMRGKTSLPRVGVQMVATRSNWPHLRPAIAWASAAGVDRFVVSNLFPYDESMQKEILAVNTGNPPVNLTHLLRREIRRLDLRVANQRADVPRRCPFVERGTLFITARGDAAPCSELAYDHPAWYFGSRRRHRRFIGGNLRRHTVDDIWQGKKLVDFRASFHYYEFPDCSTCHEPGRCHHRAVEEADCFDNTTPCGECLWAKDIVLCP